MAYKGALTSIPGAVAGADLSSSQFLFAVANSSGTFIVNTTAGGPVLGVIQDNPASGEAVNVAFSGVTKVVAGAAVAAGARVMSSAAGKAVTATSTNNFRGVALEAATADGDIITMLLAPTGVEA